MSAMAASTSIVDVAIIGGGTAGLSAALLLGRARRRVCLLDAGRQRNLPAHESHSYFTRDGTPPRELVRIGREQLAAYGTVELLATEATNASARQGGFDLTLASGAAIRAKKIILATGVRDVLPDIAHLRELWGNSVFHCPYCHGYEVRDEPIGILLGDQDDPLALAQLMKGWTDDLVVFSHARSLAPEVVAELARHGVRVQDGRVVSLDAEEGRLRHVVLEDGTRVTRSAALLRPPQATQSALAAQLGCRMTPTGYVEVNAELETSVPGVYAAGDCIRPLQQLVFAAADGAAAATSANKKLLAEAWKARSAGERDHAVSAGGPGTQGA